MKKLLFCSLAAALLCCISCAKETIATGPGNVERKAEIQTCEFECNIQCHSIFGCYVIGESGTIETGGSEVYFFENSNGEITMNAGNDDYEYCAETAYLFVPEIGIEAGQCGGIWTSTNTNNSTGFSDVTNHVSWNWDLQHQDFCGVEIKFGFGVD